MIQVHKNIKGLLFNHECVIIPGLGGIISTYRPATINHTAKMIEPPSRALSFNINLRTNDGILINDISSKEGISYESAKAIVEEFVKRSHKTLSEGRKVDLPGVGTLELSTENTLVFSPEERSNFLPSSYGLHPVTAHPITRHSSRPRSYSGHIDRKPRPLKETTPGPVRWTVTVALPVILFLLWGIFKPDSVQKVYEQTAGYISDVYYLGGGYENLKSLSSDKQETEDIIGSAEPVFTRLINKSMLTSPPATAFPAPAPVKNSPDIVNFTPGKRYYIIGGSYVKMDRARKFADALSEEGLNPRILGSEEEGRIRVSYYDFSSRDQALAMLSEVREQKNSSAWLLRK